MAATRDQRGLTAKQEAFAVHYTQGQCTKADAYRLAYPGTKMTPQQVWTEACELSKKPKVLNRINELLSEMTANDIVSAQASVKAMVQAMEQAEQAGLPGVQATCASQLMRFHELLHDRVTVDSAGPAHDEEVIKAITSDPIKQQQLRAILGSDEAFQPLRVVGEPEPE